MSPTTHDKKHDKLIMDASEVTRALTRIAHEILERNKGTQELALVGIRTGGVHLAHRIAKRIQEIERVKVPIGDLDITLYRDDLALRKEQPILKTTHVPFNISDLKIVLVDDVLFTGRTIRAAMDGLMDLPDCFPPCRSSRASCRSANKFSRCSRAASRRLCR